MDKHVEAPSLIIRFNAITDEVEQHSSFKASLFDAAFHIPGNPRLQLKLGDWRDKAAEYLDHAVSRTQQDLRSHVQRVYLHIERKDEDAVYGALVDLFTILKESSRPLRERMLKASRSILGEERYRFLDQHLDAGLRTTDAVLPSRTSLLNKGLNSASQLVMKLDTREISQQDPLVEAQDHIEYGQINEARQVLEDAILKDPGRQELHYDLLEIYRRTNAKESFLTMRQRIAADANPAADAWRELAVFFGEES
ncbi:MAG: hypothetical protein ABFS39_02070 [Pseudomonadota bacterium]